MNGPSNEILTLSLVNPAMLEIQYAVRGPLTARAAELEEELKKV